MNTRSWLTLMEYSAKHRVSLSTLRRRIKAGEIEARLIEGKYVIKDGPGLVAPTNSETIAPPSSVDSQTKPEVTKPAHDLFWQTTHGLLGEIKEAYLKILQGKEGQILQLKEEVADLKTLVRVLEDENTRLKNSQSGMKFDLDLEI